MRYKANISPAQAWEKLQNNPDSVLIDVRTSAEWFFVGVPDLVSLKKECLFIEWQIFPDMSFNGSFISHIESARLKYGQELLLLCRSGQRSAEAADFLVSNGFKECYNIKEGFEGNANSQYRRSAVDGWKFSNLPWIQS